MKEYTQGRNPISVISVRWHFDVGQLWISTRYVKGLSIWNILLQT